MVEKKTKMIVHKTFVQALGVEKSIDEQLSQAFTLAKLMEEGLIFQRIGKDYLKLRMKDIAPIPYARSSFEIRRKKNEHKELVISVPEVLVDEKEEKWFGRVLALALRMDNLSLHAKNDAGEYEKIKLPQ